MNITTVNINDSTNIELNKEDGLPQILINSDCISITLGTHDDITVQKLREIASGFLQLADSIDPQYDIEKEKCFLVKDENGMFVKLNEDGDYMIVSSDYNTCLSFKSSAERFLSKSPKIYKKMILVSIFPRKIGNIKFPLGLTLVTNGVKYDFYTSVPASVIKDYGIYDDIVNTIKNYKGGDWEWVLQSSQINYIGDIK